MPKICQGCIHMKSQGLYAGCELHNKNLKMKIPGDYTSFECSDRIMDEEKEKPK